MKLTVIVPEPKTNISPDEIIALLQINFRDCLDLPCIRHKDEITLQIPKG
jgi:hypothetical protein